MIVYVCIHFLDSLFISSDLTTVKTCCHTIKKYSMHLNTYLDFLEEY